MVRIYKDPNQQGSYVNKTKAFLEKAQAGTQVDQKQMINTYMQSIYQKLKNQEEIDDIFGELVASGMSEAIAEKLLTTVVDQMVAAGELNSHNSVTENQAEEEAAQLEKEKAEKESADQQQQESEQDEEEEPDQATDYFNSYGSEDDGAQSDEYQDGGSTEDSEDQPDYSYLEQPDTIVPGLNNYYESAVPLSFYEEPEYKRGGSKKSFVNNVLKKLKEGGEGQDESIGQGNKFDTMDDEVSKRKTNFMNLIKEQANKAKIEDLYDKMMKSNKPELMKIAQTFSDDNPAPEDDTMDQGFQSGGYVGEKQPEMFMYGGTDLPFYEADFLPEAKRGIISGKAYNTRTKEEYKDSFEGLNPYAKTVHKRGLFGRPKQWTEYYSKSTGKPIVPTDKDKNLKHGVEKELWDDLSGKAKREIRRGDRQLGREARRGAKSLAEDAKFNKGVHAEYKYENPEDLARDQKRSDDAWDKDKSFVSDIDHEGAPYKHVITKKRDLGNGEYRWDPVNIPSDPSYDNLYSDLDNAELPTVVDDFDYTSMFTPMDFEDSRVMNERDQADKELIINSGSTKDFLKFHGAKMQDLLNIEKEYRTDETEEPMLPQTFQFKPGKSKAQEFENLQEDLENEEQSDFKNQKYGFRYGGLPKAQTGLPPEKKESDATTTTNQFGNIMSKNNGLDGNISMNPNNKQGMPDQLSKQFLGDDKKEEQPEDDIIAVDKQRAPSNFDGEDAVNKFNVGATAVTGFLNNLDAAKQEKEMYENNFTSDNMYAASNSKDRGDYVDYGQQVGQFRYDQMGSDTSGRFAYGQEGGYMQKGGNTKKEILKEFTDTPEFKRGLELMMQRENTDNVDPFLNAMEEADYSEEDKTKYREAIGAMNDSEWLKIVPQKSAYTKTNRHRELQDLMNKAYGSERYNTPYAVGSGGPRRNDPSYYPMDERRPTPFEDGRIDSRTLEAIQPGPNEYEGMQTGGYMKEGGYAEGDEVFMTDEELEEFLANGGDVEYL